jgi:hypothetical protein
VSIPIGCSSPAKARPRLEHLACGGGGVSATGHVILGRSAIGDGISRGQRAWLEPGGRPVSQRVLVHARGSVHASTRGSEQARACDVGWTIPLWIF